MAKCTECEAEAMFQVHFGDDVTADYCPEHTIKTLILAEGDDLYAASPLPGWDDETQNKALATIINALSARSG